MIGEIKRIVKAINAFKKESRNAQKINRRESKEYLAEYEQLFSEAISIKAIIPKILEELKEKQLEIRYLRSDRKPPKLLGIRYLFESGNRPGKLYVRIPVDDSNEKAVMYDVCYINKDHQVIRRIVNTPPVETFYFYRKNEFTEVSFSACNEMNLIGFSKTTLDSKKGFLEVKEIEASSGDLEFDLSKREIGDCIIRIDTYSFRNSKLEKCSFKYCTPMSFWHTRFPKKLDRVKWEMRESIITVRRNDDQSPIMYTNNWELRDLRLIQCDEEHQLTKDQINAIDRFEKLYLSLLK